MKIKSVKKILSSFFLIIILNILFFCNVQAITNNSLKVANTTSESTVSEKNISLYSNSAILIDSKTGKILFEKNSNEKSYPASTTKILTAIIALEKCNLDDPVSASYNAIMSIPSGYSNAAIKEGEVLTVEQLLNVFLIHSANEAGYILAEHISGSISAFADLMNQKAIELGCTNTHFTNPSGIQDENHYSTAHDMSIIAKYCMNNEIFRQIVAKTSYTLAPTNKTTEERFFATTNDLIRPSSNYYYENCIGIKTGYTSQAKNCLISASKKENLELISVVLGAGTTETGKSARNIDTINLFNYGFSNYKLVEILEANSIVAKQEIKNATKETKELPIVCKESITAIVPTDIDLSSLQPSISINENLSAPISEGLCIGTISYNIDGIDYSQNLYAQQSVIEFNFYLIIVQIFAVLLILVLIYKILSHKPNRKKKKKKSKH